MHCWAMGLCQILAAKGGKGIPPTCCGKKKSAIDLYFVKDGQLTIFLNYIELTLNKEKKG